MLDAQTIATVKSTLPAVAAVGPELTRHFYDRLLSHHPELKNVFNMSNQRNGDQREALFNAIAAYASNLENLAVLLPAVEKIAQKHTSLNIKPEQYAVVGEHLLATIQELMDPGEEVLAAWGRAYGVLADVFIQREESIYHQSETANGGWRGTRAFRISAITDQSSVIKSIELTPVDGASVVDYRPGQYLSLYVQAEGMANRQIRQYSLTATPNGRNYRIAVKHEAAGTVSGWLHEQAKVGDVVELAAPHGDFFLDVDAQTPVALISAGVGQTPMLAMLHQLESQHHAAPVTWLHASENGLQHAFAAEVTQAGKNLAQFSQHIWYRAPEINDSGRFDQQGLMDLSQVSAAIAGENQQFYLCGPLGFMQFVAGQLRDAGVAAERIHYEVFGPHKVV